MRSPLFHALRLAALLTSAATALAQPHRDVHLYVADGSLRTGVYDFDTSTILPDVRLYRGAFGETANGTNDPGFNASASTFPAGTLLSFTILDALRSWDGSDFDTIPAERLFISLAAQNRQTPTTANTAVQGFNIVAANSAGSFHQHINYFLTSPFSTGVYLLKLRLSVTSSPQPAEPIYILFSQNASAAAVDAAAAYVQSVLLAPPHCPGDASDDGVVNFTDIVAVLAAWGTTPAPGGPGDANADGSVNFIDISSVLASWGAPCP